MLDSAESVRRVFQICYEGLGHRQLGSAYDYFSKRYWVPVAAKLIQRHIEACKSCQAFSKPNKFQLPGYIPQGGDVFSHWLIDFAGPFPKDAETGCEYVCLAVDWLSRWVEGEPTMDAFSETAADFIYRKIVC